MWPAGVVCVPPAVSPDPNEIHFSPVSLSPLPTSEMADANKDKSLADKAKEKASAAGDKIKGLFGGKDKK